MNNGTIVDIKRFAVHDGPGIRTTVFLKGCPLRCLWCHNPESISPKPEIGFLANKCACCSDCAEACSCHKIENGVHTIERQNCVLCGKCVDVCLHNALIFYGKEITPKNTSKLILEDRHFYDNSDGGATVSGGEPLLQADFCAELFRILKKENIHCAVDTCGHVSWKEFEKVLPLTDVFLYDLKHIDSTTHQSITGVENALILENLKRLAGSGKDIEIRIPIIPDMNDSDQVLKQTAEFLLSLKIKTLRLLPYHTLAHSKYVSVGRINTIPDIPPPDTTRMNTISEFFKHHGFSVK